jgi:predicted nucleic acid-binding protein
VLFDTDIFIEEYGLASGLRAGDALIAATATENSVTLTSGNGKHFKPIHGLRLRVFTA